MYNSKDFARRLSELRLIKSISARDMSLSLGQSESYINKIEIYVLKKFIKEYVKKIINIQISTKIIIILVEIWVYNY